MIVTNNVFFSNFFFTDIDNLKESRGRERAVLIPLDLTIYKHSDI